MATTRSASVAFSEVDIDESSSKRARLQEDRNDDDNEQVAPPSLAVLKDDCLLTILSYLPADDLNSIAICSHLFRSIRARPTLDQTRTGTIILMSERTTFRRLASKIVRHNWTRAFQGNRTHLKIQGLDRTLPESMVASNEVDASARMPGVKRLDLSFAIPGSLNMHMFIPLLFPNLEEIDLSSFQSSITDQVLVAISANCPRLTKITWNKCETSAHIFMCRHARGPLRLELDECCFSENRYHSMNIAFARAWGVLAGRATYMFWRCENLESLSIKNAMLKLDDSSEAIPVPQDKLIAMVRNHPSFKWLRSDLSPENIAMLKKERPDITLVNG